MVVKVLCGIYKPEYTYNKDMGLGVWPLELKTYKEGRDPERPMTSLIDYQDRCDIGKFIQNNQMDEVTEIVFAYLDWRIDGLTIEMLEVEIAMTE